MDKPKIVLTSCIGEKKIKPWKDARKHTQTCEKNNLLWETHTHSISTQQSDKQVVSAFALWASSLPGCCLSKPGCLYNGMLIKLQRLQNAQQPLQFNDCQLLTHLSFHANDGTYLWGAQVVDSFTRFKWLTNERKERVGFFSECKLIFQWDFLVICHRCVFIEEWDVVE